MTINQVAQRGIEATRILESEVYKDAMKSLRDQIVTDWKACPIRDREGQMLYLQLAKLSDKFEGILNGYVESGKMAKHKIEVDSVRNESPIRKFVRKIA